MLEDFQQDLELEEEPVETEKQGSSKRANRRYKTTMIKTRRKNHFVIQHWTHERPVKNEGKLNRRVLNDEIQDSYFFVNAIGKREYDNYYSIDEEYRHLFSPPSYKKHFKKNWRSGYNHVTRHAKVPAKVGKPESFKDMLRVLAYSQEFWENFWMFNHSFHFWNRAKGDKFIPDYFGTGKKDSPDLVFKNGEMIVCSKYMARKLAFHLEKFDVFEKAA